MSEALSRDRLRMATVLEAAQTWSRMKAQHTARPRGCPICAAAELDYRLAVRRYTDPFGVKS